MYLGGFMEQILQKIFLMVFTTFLFVACIVPFIRNIAIKVGAIDIPRNRHIHSKAMPKMGGVAIFLGFLLGYMLFGTPSASMNAILIGSFIILLVGVVDDIVEIGPKTKFLGQLFAASIIAFYGKILMQDLSAFGFYIDFGIFAYPITIIFIVACINCMNFIDGLDGLSSGISSIYFLTIGIISTLRFQYGLEFVLTFVMLGSTLGFLTHNFHPATIFAGDSGSMFLGFMVSIIALLGFKNVTLTSLIIPILILAIPILDTLFAIIRRTLKGESIAKGDRFHIHHQLLNRNFSQTTAVLTIYVVDALFAFASIVYVLKDRTLGYIIYGILLVIVVLFVAKTNVVFDKENLKDKIKNKLPKKR